MQTFLPYPDFRKSMRVLDFRRLGKQRVEACQILVALAIEGPWANHPATTMWRGYDAALEQYMRGAILEWVRRGYKNTMTIPKLRKFVKPPWVGDPSFHAAHRSNLLRKDPVYYGQFGWAEPDDLPYIWPGDRKNGYHSE